MGQIQFTHFLVEAVNKGVTASIRDLSELQEFEEYRHQPLVLMMRLNSLLEEHEISASPSLFENDDWHINRLFCLEKNSSPEDVGAEIAKILEDDELPTLEFKSSLYLDLQRLKHDPNATPDVLVSPAVVHSAMKNLCAFLNGSGGILLIGIDDDGRVVGIDQEFEFCKNSSKNVDGWLLYLRNAIDNFFCDSGDVKAHLNIDVGTIEEKMICRIKVIPRKRLSFCMNSDKNIYKCYRRLGTSSEEVPIENIESFILQRHGISEK